MAALLDNAIDPKGRIRDVSNTFIMLRVEECPVTGMAKKGPKPKSTLYEWRVKGKFTPSDSAIAEGVDVQDSEIINNESLKYVVQGRTQKGRVVIGVDDVAEELGDEYAVNGGLVADNLMDGLIMARENMELSILKNSNSAPYIDGSNPRKLRGLTYWARTSNAASADLPIPTAVLSPSGNIVSGKAVATDVTEENFITILQSIATASRRMHNLHVFATPALRARISSLTKFTPAQSTDLLTRRFNQTDLKAITMTVERMECDFGKFYLHTHFSLPSGVHALLLDMDMVQLRMTRNPSASKLPYLGGVRKTMIEYILGLECSNPQAIGKITT